MPYSRPYKRIDLPDGEWWEIWTEMSRGMRRAIQKAALDGAKIDVADPQSAIQSIEASRMAAVEDAMLLAGTKACSYGENLTAEMLDAVPDSVIQEIMGEIARVFQPMQPEESKRFFGRP